MLGARQRRIHGDDLQIETGLLRRRSSRFPLSQLQAIDIVQPGLARDQLTSADHEHCVGAHAELVEDRCYRPAPHDLDLAVGVTQPHLHDARLAHRS